MTKSTQNRTGSLLRKMWFPTALGWVAYVAMLLLFMATLPPNYNSTVNLVAICLAPVLIWGGGMAHAISAVRSTKALVHSEGGRWGAIITAIFSWCGTLLSLASLVLVCCLK